MSHSDCGDEKPRGNKLQSHTHFKVGGNQFFLMHIKSRAGGFFSKTHWFQNVLVWYNFPFLFEEGLPFYKVTQLIASLKLEFYDHVIPTEIHSIAFFPCGIFPQLPNLILHAFSAKIQLACQI